MEHSEICTIIQKAETNGFLRNTIIKLGNKIKCQQQKINNAELNTEDTGQLHYVKANIYEESIFFRIQIKILLFE